MQKIWHVLAYERSSRSAISWCLQTKAWQVWEMVNNVKITYHPTCKLSRTAFTLSWKFIEITGLAWQYLQLVKSMFSWVRCSSVFESYAGSSLAAGRATYVRQILNERPGKERHLGPLYWGLGMRLTSSCLKNSTVLQLQQQGGHGPKQVQSTKELEKAEEDK